MTILPDMYPCKPDIFEATYSPAAKVEALSAAQAGAPSDAMVDAYLQAQRRAVEEADWFGRPNIGGLHTNTVREACRAGLKAALAAAPQPNQSPAPAQPGQEGEREAFEAVFPVPGGVLEDAARESEYQRGYRHGYEQRDAEVRGALA